MYARIFRDRAILDQFAKKNNIVKASDWGKVKPSDLNADVGKKVLLRNGLTIFKTLQNIYPEIAWNKDWFTQSKERGFLNQLNNQKEVLQQFAKKHGIKSLDGWKDITLAHVRKHGLRHLIDEYGGSLRRTLIEVFKDIEWKQEWLPGHEFGSSYWTLKKHQKDFFDSLAKKLEIKEPKDWGSITRKEVYRLGGRSIVGYHYNGSVMSALKSIYPEISWQRKWFVNIPLYSRKYWIEYANQKQFMDQIAMDFQISAPKDWARITKSLIIKKGGYGLLKRYNHSIVDVIEKLYKIEYLQNPLITREHQKLENSLSHFWNQNKNFI